MLDPILHKYIHRLIVHEFELTTGDGEGQGSLACCSSWGRTDSDTAEQLNNNTQSLAPAQEKIKKMTYQTVNISSGNETVGIWGGGGIMNF